MKKAGSFFFTFVPPLLALGLEFAVTFFAMGISALCEELWYASSDRITFSDIYADLTVLWNTNQFNIGIMILFSVYGTTANMRTRFLPGSQRFYTRCPFLGYCF